MIFFTFESSELSISVRPCKHVCSLNFIEKREQAMFIHFEGQSKWCKKSLIFHIFAESFTEVMTDVEMGEMGMNGELMTDHDKWRDYDLF